MTDLQTRGRAQKNKESFPMSRYRYLLLCALLVPSVAASADTVNVLYAGSLVSLMERGMGPAYEQASGDTFQGFAGG